MMIKELKISLPFYKTAYAAAFIVILSLVRGISYSNEIGIALEPAMAILAAVFCADTYTAEIVSKRSEVWRLYPIQRRICAVGRRLAIQEFFLLFLSAAGYGMFFLFQRPRLLSGMNLKAVHEGMQFIVYLAAAAVSVGFWGILSNTLACVFRSAWFGIGGSLIFWILTNSASGERYLGRWNVFSYTFREMDHGHDTGWLAGKSVCIVLSVVMLAVLPHILKKRG